MYKLSILLTCIFFMVSFAKEPTMEELQKAVDQMKGYYQMIDDHSIDNTKNKEFDLNKKYTEQEIKEKLEEVSRILETNKNLKKDK